MSSRTCQKCGRELDASDEFCTNCGAKVPPEGAKAPGIAIDSGGEGYISAEKFKAYEVTEGVRYDENGAFYRIDPGKIPENVRIATVKAQKASLTSLTAAVMRKTYVMSIVLVPIALALFIYLGELGPALLPFLVAAFLAAPSIAIAVGSSKMHKAAKDPSPNVVSTSGLKVVNVAVWIRTVLTAVLIVTLFVLNAVIFDELAIAAVAVAMILLMPINICSIFFLRNLKYELVTCSQTSQAAKIALCIMTTMIGAVTAFMGAFVALLMPLMGLEAGFLICLLIAVMFVIYGIYTVCATKWMSDYHKAVFNAITGELKKEQESEKAAAPQAPAAETSAPKKAFCPYCGSELEEESAFCSNCGKKL